ncbi:septal ring lytic transglycosylase RlpA family protein [Siculibacillus lacustris]|uniref:Endolytic peptidoglycan transglycosylase RlpA n=1 Tax=Siculibacillus lacustris TaxID=1549641 RepID=A0A4Q9VPI6_9HYPH|nr:septal ring lytic transglycosylase RlpA family protein [Siculibacillus lacustris]TBW37641.1 septal ring lytic transglycosylase RlpA family protein [Siculibacillus lacustris]
MTLHKTGAALRRGGALRRAFVASSFVASGFVACGASAALAGSPGRTTVEGMASFYGREHNGGPTASGERFDMHALTAAHRSAAFGSRLKVTNLANGRSVVVRVNDRGPFVRSRIIDVSRSAAEALGFIRSGVTRVRLEPAATAEAETAIRVAEADPAPSAIVSDAPGLTDVDRLLIERNARSTGH